MGPRTCILHSCQGPLVLFGDQRQRDHHPHSHVSLLLIVFFQSECQVLRAGIVPRLLASVCPGPGAGQVVSVYLESE